MFYLSSTSSIIFLPLAMRGVDFIVLIIGIILKIDNREKKII